MIEKLNLLTYAMSYGIIMEESVLTYWVLSSTRDF